MIRFGLPDAKNPVGYIRFYNAFEQPLTVLGKPAVGDLTHIPLPITERSKDGLGERDEHRR